MKIFLTGSTGYVGGYVLDSLLKDGYTVKCLVRKGSEEKLKGKKVEIKFSWELIVIIFGLIFIFGFLFFIQSKAT